MFTLMKNLVKVIKMLWKFEFLLWVVNKESNMESNMEELMYGNRISVFTKVVNTNNI